MMKQNNLSLIFEISLALLSFLFSKINKFFIGNLYTIYLIFNQKKAHQWRVIDNNLVDSGLNMAVLMTKAPRWNTHAIIGTLGPFYVEKSLNIELNSANNSAKSWILIFYSFPNYQTITSLRSNQINSEENWHSLALKPGKYTMGLRYYNYGDELVLPAIKVDNQELTSSLKIANNSNDFYQTLINKKNLYYLFIHYYIYVIFRLRKFLPESFVKREFLPVGATDTKFFYDCLEENEYLELETEQFTLNKYDIYVTLYEICSLPVDSFQLNNIKQTSSSLKNKGYYLIRVRSEDKSADKFVNLNLKIQKKKMIKHKKNSDISNQSLPYSNYRTFESVN